VFADDLRPSRFEWISNNRVVAQTNQLGTEVLYYTVDGAKVPMVGIGSLVTFQGLTQGVLQTAGRTIQAALDLEKASAVLHRHLWQQDLLKTLAQICQSHPFKHY
jgi:hypothetical protein